MFKDKGYAQTTTRDIADAAEIKRGLLHYYYRQKEDILAEMYTELIVRMQEFLKMQKKFEQGVMTSVVVFNFFYFKAVSYYTFLDKIVADVLSSHALKVIKIEKTIDLYKMMYAQASAPFDERALYLSTATAIGAESELYLSKVNGKIDITSEELAETISKLEFAMFNINSESITKHIESAKREVEDISVAEFSEFLKRKILWC